jgi:hypothetical protein
MPERLEKTGFAFARASDCRPTDRAPTSCTTAAAAPSRPCPSKTPPEISSQYDLTIAFLRITSNLQYSTPRHSNYSGYEL